LCSVTGIQHHAVFCTLDEFNGRTGMIHISEIAPGRIKNIKEYVKEGQKIVCKVLRVNKEKGYIDLSLRRVNEGQKRVKLNEIKQAQLCGKIIENVSKSLKKEFDGIYDEVNEKITKKYPSLFSGFEAVSKDEDSFDALGISKELSSALYDAVKQRIKPPELFVEGSFTLTSHNPEGVELIKQILSPIESEKAAKIAYLGAGQFNLKIACEDYKQGEKLLKKIVDNVLSAGKKLKVNVEFKRKEA